MTKVLALIKSIFEMLKSMVDFLGKREDIRKKKRNDVPVRTDGNAKKVNTKESTTKRKPWLVIRDGEIEVYKDTEE